MSSLQTGINALDRQLDGGFSEGNLVALVAPPDSPSSRILQQLLQQRPTTYISTLRPRDDLATKLEPAGTSGTDVEIAEVGEANAQNDMLHMLSDSKIYAAQTTDRDHVLDDVHDILDDISESRNVIIDPVNPLESNDDKVAYQRFLRATAAKMRETDGLGVFHCLSRGEAPGLREQTLAMADTVWNLDLGTDNEGNLTLKMTVPKNRGGAVILEKLTLLFDRDRVHADNSRSI